MVYASPDLILIQSCFSSNIAMHECSSHKWKALGLIRPESSKNISGQRPLSIGSFINRGSLGRAGLKSGQTLGSPNISMHECFGHRLMHGALTHAVCHFFFCTLKYIQCGVLQKGLFSKVKPNKGQVFCFIWTSIFCLKSKPFSCLVFFERFSTRTHSMLKIPKIVP